MSLSLCRFYPFIAFQLQLSDLVLPCVPYVPSLVESTFCTLVFVYASIDPRQHGHTLAAAACSGTSTRLLVQSTQAPLRTLEEPQ